MSKVDAQRALRDARYARFAARASEVAPRPTPSAGAPAKKKAAPADAGLVELFAVEPASPPTKPEPAKPEPAQSEPAQSESAMVEPTMVEPTMVDVPAPEQVQAAPGDPAEDGAEDEAALELCGHRSINGRSCTRDKGHPQKNHRYN